LVARPDHRVRRERRPSAASCGVEGRREKGRGRQVSAAVERRLRNRRLYMLERQRQEAA
jgi:hypothetical protein